MKQSTDETCATEATTCSMNKSFDTKATQVKQEYKLRPYLVSLCSWLDKKADDIQHLN